MSKLVISNLELALPGMLRKLYEVDLDVRHVYLRVFSLMLKSGVDVTAMPSSSTSAAYDELIDVSCGLRTLPDSDLTTSQLLCQADLTLLLGICEVCTSPDSEEITEVLLSALDSRGMAVTAIKAIVEKEINETGALTTSALL